MTRRCRTPITGSSGAEVQSDAVSTNGTRNVVFSLLVTEDIEVWWGRDASAAGEEQEADGDDARANAANSNVAWQSAVLLLDG